jgi:hypothetical protein
MMVARNGTTPFVLGYIRAMLDHCGKLYLYGSLADADFSPFPVFGQVYDTTIVRTEQLLAGVDQLDAAVAP